MNKKVYMKPLTIEFKIETNQLMSVSGDAQVYNEVSTNASYSREGRGFGDDE